MSRFNPPQYHELEVSVFGPGRGECVVVHLGYGKWCVVDSCIERGKSISAALEYLTGLGTNALEGVLLVVATHWHDDHIRGIANCLREFPYARFACSAALQTEHFIKLVKLEQTTLQQNSGVDEFGSVLDLLLERRQQDLHQNLVSPQWAIENRSLLQLSTNPRLFPASITALSPSDGTLKLAFDKIGGLIPQPGEAQRRIPNETPNKTSVALWLEVGLRRVLLGADLEHSGRVGEGWMAVIDSFQGTQKADLFKVPHHGSRNADCPGTWSHLLNPDPLTLLTPFASGVGLPQQSDLKRLFQRTTNLYCTAVPKPKLPKRDNMVERKLRMRERVALEGKLGHVRVRWSATDLFAEPRIELFEGAFKVTPASLT
jgi:hypothetical protein